MNVTLVSTPILPQFAMPIGIGCYANEIDINYLLKRSICGLLTLPQ